MTSTKTISKSGVSIIFASTLAASLAVGSANAATTQGSASVTMQNQAITLTQVDPLNFGTILPFGRNGTVSVSHNGNTSTNNAYQVAPGAPSNWAVTGVNNAPYSITLPANSSVILTNTGGAGETMTINSFNRTGGTAQRYLDAAGVASFSVGGILAIGANQPAGVYTGTYEVTVSYN